MAFVTPNTNDERQNGAAGGELEFLLREDRQDGSLQANHCANEGVDADEQCKLDDVLSKTQLDGGRTRGVRTVVRRQSSPRGARD